MITARFALHGACREQRKTPLRRAIARAVCAVAAVRVQMRRPAPGARAGRRRRRWRCARRRPARADHRPDPPLPVAAGPAGGAEGLLAPHPGRRQSRLRAARPRPRPGRRPAPRSATGGRDRRAGSGSARSARVSSRVANTAECQGRDGADQHSGGRPAAVRASATPAATTSNARRERSTRAAPALSGLGTRSSSGRTTAPRVVARPESAGCSRRAASRRSDRAAAPIPPVFSDRHEKLQVKGVQRRRGHSTSLRRPGYQMPVYPAGSWGLEAWPDGLHQAVPAAAVARAAGSARGQCHRGQRRSAGAATGLLGTDALT